MDYVLIVLYIQHTLKIVNDNYLGVGGRISIGRSLSICQKNVSGRAYIEISPKNVGKNRGLKNIKNKDDKCFQWCHGRFLIYNRGEEVHNPQRLTIRD